MVELFVCLNVSWLQYTVVLEELEWKLDWTGRGNVYPKVAFISPRSDPSACVL